MERDTYIFLLFAVISLDAFSTRSRRSWCSSSSARKYSNIGIYGELEASGVILSFVVDLGFVVEDGFLPFMVSWVRFVPVAMGLVMV